MVIKIKKGVNKVNLTERDIDVVDFINMYKAATTKMLVDLMYNNYNVGTRRLKMLTDGGYIKRSRISTGEWLYHIDESNDLLLKNFMITKFIVSLMERGVDVEEVYYGKKIGDITVDAQFIVSYKDKKHMLLVESNIIGGFNSDKYTKLYMDNKSIKGYIPKVVIIDNKSIDTETPYSLVRINRDMSNIDKMLCELEGIEC